MKVLFLSDPNSPHTIKWVTSLVERGIDINVLGLGDYDEANYKKYNVKVYPVRIDSTLFKKGEGYLSKFKYLKALPELKKIIKIFNPDILHAHYATSYGLLGALSGFHPLIISVWGSDIFSFPKKSFMHKCILKYNLHKADKILSTSHVMAKETNIYTDKEIEVTPFGIDLDQFKPIEVESFFDKSDIVIGTVKTLEEKYGIEYLIRAFKILCDKYPNLPLKLLIVGSGSLEKYLKELCKKLHIERKTVFTGKVSHIDVPKYLNMLSIYVALSISESFGVAVLEACACEKPVVVSNVGGLPEVVENGVTGIVVPPRDPQKAAEAIEKLILDEDLRRKMGENGRERVEKFYNWNDNVKQMIKIYEELVKSCW